MSSDLRLNNNSYSNYFVTHQRNGINKPTFNSFNDTFVPSKKIKGTLQQKLNNLFPNGMLEKIYSQIGQELGIDVLPELKFYDASDGVVAGGFRFSKNEISFSLDEIFANDQKVVLLKNGKYKPLMSPKDNMPLFIGKELGEKFVNANKAQFKKIADDLQLMPMTDDDIRKFVIHKMCHELIHAQQHMIMRATEGIGEKEIIKAWTHILPQNDVETQKLNEISENVYKTSFWANTQLTPVKYKKESDIGKLAYTFLDAIRKYPPVDSPEYAKNAIEADAFKRSYEYVVKNLGPY